MSRSWQYHGFNKAAQTILAERKKIGTKTFTIEWEDGSEPTTGTESVTIEAYTKEVYDKNEPWMDVEDELHILRFADGRILEEYVQAEPWSSGPCTFMALRDHVTKEPLPETLWDNETINRA